MISRPLFIIVAESIVIFGPIFQVGCARASSTVIASKVERSRSRNGPPDAVRTSRATSCGRPLYAQRLMDRAMLGVHRQDLSPAVARGVEDELSADDERFLVREGEPLARFHRRVSRAQPQCADEPADDDVRALEGRHFVEPLERRTRSVSEGPPGGETLACARRRPGRRRPARGGAR